MHNEIDYLVLGQTVPEKSKKYGVRVCTAGYSLEKDDFVRVYPLLVKYHFKRWQLFGNLPVVKNNKDHRPESWKLKDHPSKIPSLERKEFTYKKRKPLIESIYQKHKYTSIKALNEEKKSLAIIKLIDPVGYFVDHQKKNINPRQLSLFDEEDETELTKEGFKYLPRIKFKDEEGGKHDLWFNSWDAYMHQKFLSKKYGVDNLWDATKMKTEKYALIGNLNHLRNTWLIISVF